MRADGDPVTASVESGEVLFMSRLLRVEPVGGFMVLAWSAEKHANLGLLGEGIVTFSCNHRGAHYEFAAGGGRETQHAGELAIQFTLPVALMATERRSQARTPVPARVPLRCELPLGPASLAASVVDMTLGGMGSLLYDASIGIEPGTRIERALIRHPRRAAIVADLEVRYVTRVALPDGRPANRAGCKIFADTKEIEELIRLFITELE